MPTQFNKDLLDKHLSQDNAIGLEEYEKLTQNTIIKFKCKCGISCEKQFRRLTISGALCKTCTVISHSEKLSGAAKKNFKPSESYNKETLDKYVSDSGSHLIGELPPLKKEAIISFQCKCGNVDSKTFVRIKETGVLCKTCTWKQRSERREATNMIKYGATCTLQNPEIKEKAEITCLERYGVKNALESTEIKEQIKETNLIRYGSENPFGSEIIKEKLRNTCKEIYGSEFPMCNPAISAKTKETNLRKYGVEVSSKASCVKEKAKQTNLKIYGEEHHCCAPSIIEKKIQTNLIRYGVPCSFQSPQVKHKIKNTLKFKYGVNYTSKIPGVLQKRIETSLKKYGVRFPMQNKEIQLKQERAILCKYGVRNPNQSPVIQAKAQKTGLRYKTYITSNGDTRKVQGYEPQALDKLFKEHGMTESDVITDRGAVPRITYTSNNKSRYYFPDIYIPSQNKLIEVKSTWTYTLHSEINCLKLNAARAAGYTCEVWIFNKKTWEIVSDDNKISHV